MAVNSNNVAIWSSLAAVCNAKFPPALCSPIETVCYLFTLLIPEVVRSRLPGNFDWPKCLLVRSASPSDSWALVTLGLICCQIEINVTGTAEEDIKYS